MPDHLVYIIGVPVIIVLATITVRRVIALRAAIKQHFEDEATGPKDPYAQMAEVAKVQQAIEDEKKRSRQANELLRKSRRKQGK